MQVDAKASRICTPGSACHDKVAEPEPPASLPKYASEFWAFEPFPCLHLFKYLGRCYYQTSAFFYMFFIPAMMVDCPS